MLEKRPMGFPFKVPLALIICWMIGTLVPGCISYQLVKQVQGLEVRAPDSELKAGETTLGEVLSLYGAPDKLKEIGGRELLIYERAIYTSRQISLGIPLRDIFQLSAKISTSGRLGRYDTLVLFFTPDGILQHLVYEKGSDYPYLKSILGEEGDLREE